LCSHSTKKQHTVGRDTVVLCNKTSDTKQFSEHVTRNSAEIRAVFYHEMFISESVQVISSGLAFRGIAFPVQMLKQIWCNTNIMTCWADMMSV